MGDIAKSKLPCDDCGSSDALSIYEDGSKYCFSCHKFTPKGDGQAPSGKSTFTKGSKLSPKEIAALPIPNGILDRGLDAATCEKFEIRVEYDESTREPVAYFYPVTKGGKITGYKKRPANEKAFTSIGDTKVPELFGQWRAGSGGKMVIVTEGEYDAMAATQMLAKLGKNYRVVSLPHGANVKDLKTNLEWLEKFDTIVLNFDNDKAGDECLSKAVDLFTPNKVKVMKLTTKDANDLLISGKPVEYMRALNNAKVYQPDGIVSVDDVYEEAIKPVERGLPWPWPTLTRVTYGRRRKELYGFGAGSGCGKTEGFKEIIQHVVEVDKLPVGLLFLEEPPATTLKVIAGKLVNKRFHIPDAGWTQDELISGINSLKGKVYLYNHFGQKSWEVLRAKIRYMVICLGIKDIFLDHLTALVADEDDGNVALSKIMADMAGMTQELDFTLYYISHLATPSGKPHEEGGRVTASQFRGSRTIMFWSHFLFGYERNQQEEDITMRNTTTFRVLKDRYTGLATGTVFDLFYDHETGRLEEVSNMKIKGDY